MSDFGSLGDSLPVGLIGAVGMATVVYANDAATAMFGRSEEELLGLGWEAAVHPDDRAEMVDAVAVVVETGARQRIAVRMVDDGERWLELTLASLGPRDRPSGWLATVDEVSDRVRGDRELVRRATHDPLTRLPNRALLLDRLHLAGRRLEQREVNEVVAVLYLDLDHFKAVNDSHGHAVGDVVLVQAALRFSGVIRAIDTVARIGGDEFVAVCELSHPDDAAHLVERMHAALVEPIAVPGGRIVLTASIGVAMTSQPMADIEVLIEEADREMYLRKA